MIQNRFKIPPVFVGLVFLLCIIPAILIFREIEVPQHSDSQTINTGDFIYFTFWLISGMIVSLTAGAFCLLGYSVKKDLALAAMGIVLLAAGCHNLIYILTLAGNTSYLLAPSRIYQNWFISGVLELILLILSACMLKFTSRTISSNKRIPVGIGEPPSEVSAFATNDLGWEKNTSRTVILTLGFSSLILVLFSSLILPEFKLPVSLQYSSNRLINHPYEGINIFLYLFTGFFLLPGLIKHYPSLFLRLLLLSIVPGAFSGIFMAVHNEPFDLFFNTAYFLKFVHYSIPLVGLALSYRETSTKNEKTVTELYSQLAELLHIEHKLKERLELLVSAEKLLDDNIKTEKNTPDPSIDDTPLIKEISEGHQETERKDQHFEILKLSDVIRQVLLHLEPTIGKRRARVEVQAGVVIEGNRAQLHQLFQILIFSVLHDGPTESPVIIRISTRISFGEGIIEKTSAFKKNIGYVLLDISGRSTGWDLQNGPSRVKDVPSPHLISNGGTDRDLDSCRKILADHSGFLETIASENTAPRFRVFIPLSQNESRP